MFEIFSSFPKSNVWSAVVTLLLYIEVLRTMKCISSLRGTILQVNGMMIGSVECRNLFECVK